jgi:hypothetical protein
MEDYSRFIRHSSDEIRCAKEKLIGMFMAAGLLLSENCVEEEHS